MNILVQRPQFDIDVLKRGVAIQIRHIGGPGVFGDEITTYNGIITKSNPLKIYVARCDNNDDIDIVDITVDEVSGGNVSISILGLWEEPQVRPQVRPSF